jgi:hypothetical protein
MSIFTSTVTANATYVAKFVAGGSGDNVVPDGYIKSVEKIWMDTYTIAYTNTNTTVVIAEIPTNKKITSIYVDILGALTFSNATISIGYVQDAATCISATGVDDFMVATVVSHNLTRCCISLPYPGIFMESVTTTSSTVSPSKFAGFQAVTEGTNTTIGIKINNYVGTTGTIKSIVRYT